MSATDDHPIVTDIKTAIETIATGSDIEKVNATVKLQGFTRNPNNGDMKVGLSGIAALLNLIEDPNASLEARGRAAGVLGILASNEKNRVMIVLNRGTHLIKALVDLIEDRKASLEAKEYVVQALGNLASGNLPTDIAIRERIGKARLGGSNRLFEALVSLINQRDSIPDLKEYAVMALANFAFQSERNKAEIARAGIIVLINFINRRDSTPKAKKYATKTLFFLSSEPNNYETRQRQRRQRPRRQRPRRRDMRLGCLRTSQ